VANNCFTDKEIKELGLEGLTPEEQVRKVIDKINDAERNKSNLKLQVLVNKKNIDKAVSHPHGPASGVKGLAYADRTELSQSSGAEAHIETVITGYHSKIYNIMEEFMPRKLGLATNEANQIELLKAIRGESADPKFVKMASEFSGVAEDIRVRFNKAGGRIKKLSDWGLPVHHDEYLIKNMGYDAWHDFTLEQVDLNKMNLEGVDTRKEWRQVFDSIVSGGIIGLKTDLFNRTSAVSKRHQLSRYFKFKDSASQYRYMDKFSDTSIFTSVTDYISTLSQEIGLMERFGPNPDAGWKHLMDAAKKEAYARGEKESFVNAENAWEELIGRTSPSIEGRKAANIMSTFRNIEVGLKLPGATLSALPDVLLNSITAKYNGLPAVNVMKRFVGNLSHISASDRKMAARMHMSLRFMTDSAHSAMRFAEVTGHKSSARFASVIMRGSGLNHWTVAGKMAFHMEFMAQMGGKNWDSRLKKSMKRYGITEGDQKKIKDSVKYTKDGVDYLDPEVLPRATMERVIAMVSSETKYAVPEGDVLVRAVMHRGTRKGETGGELLRSLPMMFKTFPAAMIANHWARALYGFEGNNASRVGYMMATVIGMWVMGAFVFQLKEISKGREPVDWDNPNLWKEAAIQSGIFSVIGDIVNSDSRNYGQSALDFFGGPIAGDANKVLWNGILGSMDDMRDSEKQLSEMFTGAGATAAQFVPGQFWYSKLIMERMFLDSLKKLGDPNYDLKKMRREQRHYERFENEKYYR